MLELRLITLGAVGADATVFLHDLGLFRGNDSSSPYRETKMAILEAVHDFDYAICITTSVAACRANLPNRYSALCRRPVTRAQTWASHSTLYRFRRLCT